MLYDDDDNDDDDYDYNKEDKWPQKRWWRLNTYLNCGERYEDIFKIILF